MECGELGLLRRKECDEGEAECLAREAELSGRGRVVVVVEIVWVKRGGRKCVVVFVAVTLRMVCFMERVRTVRAVGRAGGQVGDF